MILKIVLLLHSIYPTSHSDQSKDYSFVFDRVDNRVEILVNDSVIYDSGTIIDPSSFYGKKVSLGAYLKYASNKVVVRLYNGAEPYRDQIDQEWQLKYRLLEGETEFEHYREKGKDYKIGLILEEKYYL